MWVQTCGGPSHGLVNLEKLARIQTVKLSNRKDNRVVDAGGVYAYYDSSTHSVTLFHVSCSEDEDVMSVENTQEIEQLNALIDQAYEKIVSALKQGESFVDLTTL